MSRILLCVVEQKYLKPLLDRLKLCEPNYTYSYTPSSLNLSGESKLAVWAEGVEDKNGVGMINWASGVYCGISDIKDITASPRKKDSNEISQAQRMSAFLRD